MARCVLGGIPFIFTMETTPIAVEVFKGHEIRVYGAPERPLFVATDVGRVLGIKAPQEGLEEHEWGAIVIADARGRKSTVSGLTEAGVYSLIWRSERPVAKSFGKWLTTTVLPSVRHGAGGQVRG